MQEYKITVEDVIAAADWDYNYKMTPQDAAAFLEKYQGWFADAVTDAMSDYMLEHNIL